MTVAAVASALEDVKMLGLLLLTVLLLLLLLIEDVLRIVHGEEPVAKRRVVWDAAVVGRVVYKRMEKESVKYCAMKKLFIAISGASI